MLSLGRARIRSVEKLKLSRTVGGFAWKARILTITQPPKQRGGGRAVARRRHCGRAGAVREEARELSRPSPGLAQVTR